MGEVLVNEKDQQVRFGEMRLYTCVVLFDWLKLAETFPPPLYPRQCNPQTYGPLLLTWIYFNPSMDKLSHAQ